MAEVKYPNATELIELNRRVLREIKAKKADQHKVLSRRGLDNVLKMTREQDGDIYEKAVTLMTSLVRVHVFASGNRRTAYTATMGFLEMNGRKTTIVHNPKVLQGIRQHFYTRNETKEWLKGHEIREFRRA